MMETMAASGGAVPFWFLPTFQCNLFIDKGIGECAIYCSRKLNEAILTQGNPCIDTTTSGGKLIFHIFGVLAEFERDIIKERTTTGLIAA